MQSTLEYPTQGLSSIASSVPLVEELDLGACGRAALAANRLEEATTLMQQAIRNIPGDADSHNCLGIALSRQGKHTDAIESFARAVQLGPSNPRFWHNLGAAHQAARHPMKAARYYQIAIRLLPSYQMARSALHALSADHPSLRIANGDEIPIRSVSSGALSGIELADAAVRDLCAPVFQGQIPAEPAVHAHILAEPGYLLPPPECALSSVTGGANVETKNEIRGVDLETLAEAMERSTASAPLIASLPEPEVEPFVEPAPEQVAVVTAHQPSAAGPAPGILPRFAAALADAVVIQALWVVVVIAVNAAQRAMPNLPQMPNGVPILLGALGGLVYVVSMTHGRGQTLGKSLLHLKVVDRDGAKPGIFRSAFRTIAMPLSAATFGLGYIWLEFDRRSQTLHDKLSSTYVIGRRLDPGAGMILLALLAALNWGLFDFLRVQLFA